MSEVGCKTQTLTERSDGTYLLLPTSDIRLPTITSSNYDIYATTSTPSQARGRASTRRLQTCLPH